MGVLFLVAVVHTTVGAIQFKEGNGFMLFPFSGGAYGSRASGMLICPNHLAGFLEAIALLALSVTFWGRWKLPVKLLACYIALYCLVGLAITGSRGGYLSFVFGLIAFAALSLWVVFLFDRQRFVLSVMGTILILGLSLGLATYFMHNSQTIKQRMQRIGTASEDVRWYNWLATIDQFKTSPLLGTGSGTHLYYGRLYRRQPIQTDPEHSHGDYLEMLAEYGIVGEALALFFLVAHISQGLATARNVTLRRLCNIPGMGGSDTLALTLGALSAVAALLAHSVVDFNMHIPGNALLFAFFFASLCSPGTEKPSPDPATPPETLLRGVLGVAGIGLLACIALQYKGELLSNRARLALNQRDFKECARLADLALEAAPGNPRTYFYQGEAYRATGASMPSYGLKEIYFTQAIDAYRKGLKYFPQDENLWIRLGQCLDATFQFEEAGEAYLHAIATDPNLGILYAYYAAHLRLVGDPEGAEQCTTAAQELGAGNIEKIGMGELFSLPGTPSEGDAPTSN